MFSDLTGLLWMGSKFLGVLEMFEQLTEIIVPARNCSRKFYSQRLFHIHHFIKKRVGQLCIRGASTETSLSL